MSIVRLIKCDQCKKTVEIPGDEPLKLGDMPGGWSLLYSRGQYRHFCSLNCVGRYGEATTLQLLSADESSSALD